VGAATSKDHDRSFTSMKPFIPFHLSFCLLLLLLLLLLLQLQFLFLVLFFLFCCVFGDLYDCAMV